MARRARRLFVLLRQAGPARVSHVLFVSYVMPVVMEALAIYAPVHPKIKKVWQWLAAGSDMREYRARHTDVIAAGRSGYRTSLDDFGLEPSALAEVRRRLSNQGEVVLGEFDQDGLLLSHFGPVADVRTVDEAEFFPRLRFTLTVVTDGRVVGVRKQYRRDRLSFITEVKALHRLAAAGCRVPAILAIDFDNLALTYSYIKGRELRLELAARGAQLLDRVILKAPGYEALSPEQRRGQQIDHGRPHLAGVVDAEYVEKLFAELRKLHRAGFVWKDIKYGNMLIGPEQDPYIIDFDTAYDHARTPGPLFRLLCDRNIEEFNRCFGTVKLTYRRIKDQIRSEAGRRDGYSPAYFGYGLRTGAILKNYVGDGRWHYMMKSNMPPLAGARLLDIGSNDAFHSLQSLRNGAAEAIAIERNGEAIARGLWFKAAFEWADNRAYDFRYVQTDMSQLPALDLGRFDFAMALCSIYYLDDAGIARLIRHLSTITDVLLLMGNTETDIGRTDPHEYVRASVAYTVDAMAANGFPHTRVVAPGGYSRPLVIGRKQANGPR